MARRLTPDMVETYANLKGAPLPVVMAIWQQESDSGKNVKTSPKGAVGDFQLMPATFKKYVPNGNIYDPVDNMQAGVSYIKDLADRYGGDPEKIAQAYYHGSALGAKEGEGPTSGPGTPTVFRYGKNVAARAAKFAQSRGENTLASLATPTAGATSTAPTPVSEPSGSGSLADLFGSGMAGLTESKAPMLSESKSPMLSQTQYPDLGRLGGGQPTPSTFVGPNDLAANEQGSQDYELDKYLRSLVDEELRPNA